MLKLIYDHLFPRWWYLGTKCPNNIFIFKGILVLIIMHVQNKRKTDDISFLNSFIPSCWNLQSIIIKSYNRSIRHCHWVMLRLQHVKTIFLSVNVRLNWIRMFLVKIVTQFNDFPLHECILNCLGLNGAAQA